MEVLVGKAFERHTEVLLKKGVNKDVKLLGSY
jgi:hypothetical protein